MRCADTRAASPPPHGSTQSLAFIGPHRAFSLRLQDIIQKWPSKKNADLVTLKNKNHVWSFNGVTSIRAKVSAAIDQGAGSS
jgi:hypothetical protein